jgi:hypothetical protein
MTPRAPAGLRVQFADGTERPPDAILYAGKTSLWRFWQRPRLDQWEVYVVAPAQPVGFTADIIPGYCALTFHVRHLDREGQ